MKDWLFDCVDDKKLQVYPKGLLLRGKQTWSTKTAKIEPSPETIDL